MTPQRDQELQILQNLAEHDPAWIGNLREQFGEDETAIAVDALKNRGLVRVDQRGNGGCLRLMPAGRQEIEAVQARQKDPGVRRRACRVALLQSVEQRGATTETKAVARQEFDGSADLLPFTDEESAGAAAYLVENGLLGSIPAAEDEYVLLWITQRGLDCRDRGGDVARFVAAASPPSGSQVFNITGDRNTIAAAMGDDNRVKVSMDRFDHEKAVEFAEAVRQALPVLPEMNHQEVNLYVGQIVQRENRTLAHKATAALQTLVLNAAGSALTTPLLALASAALGIS